MIVLALDTALGACQAALVWGDALLARRSEPMERGHQERLAPLTAELFAEARLAPAAVERVVVTRGPGSFTGLRVGVAFAKGMALGLGKPLVGVGTLEALAEGGEGRRAAVIAAPHGRVYLQAFDGARALAAPQLLPIGEAQALCRDLVVEALVGPGAGVLELALPADLRPWLDPFALARLGAALAPEPGPLLPLYLREPDAKTTAEREAEKAARA